MGYVTSGILLTILLSAAPEAAQDSTVTTDTSVKSDDGKVVKVVGCVEIGGGTSFMLTNVVSAVDQRGRTAVPRGGPYALKEREGLDIAPFINQKVELTGVVVPPATKEDADAEIRIKETTTVDGENGRDKKTSSGKTVKVPRKTATQFVVASVKPLAPTCQN